MIKKIKLGLSAMVAFAMMFATSAGVAAQESVAVSNNNTEITSSKVDKNPSQSPLELDAAKYPVLLQTGGNVYFTVPDDTSTWANPANWAPDPNNPSCPSSGNNICRVRLDDDQTLGEFLTANGSSSYATMLTNSQIDRKP